jgi:hypothetical protein
VRFAVQGGDQDGEVEAKAMTRAELARLLAKLPDEWGVVL